MTGRRIAIELRLGRAQYNAGQKIIRAITGLKYHSVTVDGRSYPFLRGGRGPTLLLIHGFGDRKETFAPLSLSLFRHFDLVMVDLPGFGDAPAVSSDRITPAAQSSFLLAFLDAIGVARTHVCGQSMGGALAARFVDDHPDRAFSLTLISAAGADGLSDEFERLRESGRNPMLVTNLREFQMLLDLGFARPLIYPRAIKRFLAAQWGSRLHEHRSHFERLTNPLPGEEMARDFAAINVPTQIIYGQQERLLHRDNMDTYRRGIANSRLHVLEGVGHNPHHEAPRAVAQLIRANLT